MMNDEELSALVDDMKQYGYDETAPVITLDGKILDGRNRYKAAGLAGVSPVFAEYEGENPLEFVIRHNLKRRHLNESQRAVIAAKLANMEQGGDRKSKNQSINLDFDMTQQQAADMFNVSRATVATVKAIEKAAKLAPEKT